MSFLIKLREKIKKQDLCFCLIMILIANDSPQNIPVVLGNHAATVSRFRPLLLTNWEWNVAIMKESISAWKNETGKDDGILLWLCDTDVSYIAVVVSRKEIL